MNKDYIILTVAATMAVLYVTRSYWFAQRQALKVPIATPEGGIGPDGIYYEWVTTR